MAMQLQSAAGLTITRLHYRLHSSSSALHGVAGSLHTRSAYSAHHISYGNVVKACIMSNESPEARVAGFNHIPRATASPATYNVDPQLQSSLDADEDHDHMKANFNGAVKSIIPPWMDAFYRFSKPHSTIGTVVGVIGVCFLALQSLDDLSLHFLIGVIQALVPTLLIHIYIMGINQVIDVDIDKVNKPFLPLVSGELSLNRGISLTIICATLGLAMGTYIGSKPLMWVLSLGYAIGTAYSIELPFMRWKRWGFSATASILFLRAIALQLCIFLHMQTFVLGRPAMLNKPIIFLSSFMCFLSGVYAIFKDIPDLEGDKIHGMQTYVVRAGQKPVFWFCVNVLLIAYGGAMIVGLTSKMLWARIGAVLGHGIAAGLLWHRATTSDPKDKGAMYDFYIFIWKLLYAEYFLAQFIR